MQEHKKVIIERKEEIRAEYLNEYSLYRFNNVSDQSIRRIEKRPTHVQAFINNISVPKSLEELQVFIYEHGCFNVEDILSEEDTNWTAPRWAKIGDIVFFMHAKYGFSYLTALRTELNNNSHLYNKEEYDLMMDWINRGLALNKKYGGKIFAIAQVSGTPEYLETEWDEDDVSYHWSSRIYADMDKVTVLEEPIDISQFKNLIFVSRQSAITPVLGEDFKQLKDLIKKFNKIPNYFEISDATPMPLTKFNESNWMTMANEFRRSFMLEAQFRTYYVNYLLQAISDRKKIYKECRCRKNNIPDSFIDNVIYINGKYLPVEVKLSVPAQIDIKGQVSKYCDDEFIVLDSKEKRLIYPKNIFTNNCLVIDTNYIYMYNYNNDNLSIIYKLDDLKRDIDLTNLKKVILDSLINS